MHFVVMDYRHASNVACHLDHELDAYVEHADGIIYLGEGQDLHEYIFTDAKLHTLTNLALLATLVYILIYQDLLDVEKLGF